MGSKVLPSVDAITAVEDSEGIILLLGLGNYGYDRRTTQHEALWNSHHLRANKVKVSNVQEEEDGDQCIRIKDESSNLIIIPLKFNGDIMTIGIRTPTKEELLALRVNCSTPPMEKLTHPSIQRIRVALEDHNIQLPGQDQKVPEEELNVQ